MWKIQRFERIVPMGFIESSSIAFQVGLRSLFFGFAVYFFIKVACGALNLTGLWRLGLTVATVLLYLSPEFYDLAFPPDTSIFLLEPAASPDGLWVAIKAKFYAAVIGQAVAFGVDKYFFPG
jgi:hypothetical protein